MQPFIPERVKLEGNQMGEREILRVSVLVKPLGLKLEPDRPVKRS